ncbi:hypothetical protein HMPREF3209_02295 [Lactobacillus crispatus]|nr:hypothetical protein HMPREF3209_02295 [Lactobacillus crispatus]
MDNDFIYWILLELLNVKLGRNLMGKNTGRILIIISLYNFIATRRYAPLIRHSESKLNQFDPLKILMHLMLV